MSDNETVSQAEFARRHGYSRSYITQLKNEGKLVMDADGKKIVEDKSVALINASRYPDKQGVADMHARNREQKPMMDEITGKAGSAYQQARAMREKYAAMQAKIAYEKETGELLEASAARMAVMDGDAIVRQRLESLPDILAPQLAAENDEQKIRATLIDQVEIILADLSRTFKNLVKP